MFYDKNLFVKSVIEEFTNDNRRVNKDSQNLLIDYFNNLREIDVSKLIINKIKE